MNFAKFIGVCLLSGLALLGCFKREPVPEPPKANLPVPALRLHWIGKDTVFKDTQAAGLMKIWELPESEVLEAQTLERLASAPWRARLNWTTNALEGTPAELSALCRTLLQQAWASETFFEIHRTSNSSPALAIAVRVDPPSASLWETSSAAIAENLFSAKRESVKSGWKLKPPGGSNVLSFSRVTDGIAIAWAPDKEEILRTVAAHLERPSVTSTNSVWLLARMNLPQLLPVLGRDESWISRMPDVLLSIHGDGSNVLTHAEMSFTEPLPATIEKWQIPTNLIHDPIHSFGAIQGIKPLLASSSLWTILSGGSPAPNQYFWWSQAGAPFLTYGAIPVSEINTTFSTVSTNLSEMVNPRLTNVMAGKIVANPSERRIAWTPFPAMEPAIVATTLPEGNFLHISLANSDNTNSPPPQATLDQLNSVQNLIYYHREMTGARMEPGLYMSQLSRLVFRREQLPFDGKAIAWLKAASLLLMEAKTQVVRTDPNHLLLDRTSSTGFTMAELQLIADWLESPSFPINLHSAVVKLPPRSPRKNQTEVPARP